MASIRVARALLGAALVWACDGRYATAMGTFTQSLKVRRKVLAAWSMGRPAPPLRADVIEAEPLADYHGETGEVQWHPEWIALLDQLQIAHD